MVACPPRTCAVAHLRRGAPAPAVTMATGARNSFTGSAASNPSRQHISGLTARISSQPELAIIDEHGLMSCPSHMAQGAGGPGTEDVGMTPPPGTASERMAVRSACAGAGARAQGWQQWQGARLLTDDEGASTATAGSSASLVLSSDRGGGAAKMV